MARISGLSISLDLNTAGVDRSLTQIKKSFSSLRKSAQVNMNNMKFDTKDLTTYKKNLDNLNDSYKAQEQNVDDVEKKMRQLSDAGQENSSEFMSLNAEYNRQVDELNRLGNALDKAEAGLRDVYNESSKFTQIGNTFGNLGQTFTNLGGSIQNAGRQIQGVGSSLTRNITMPVAGVVAAAGGITAAFGWGRLSGLDTAQAQLKGLGYSTEEVGSISDTVTDAIEGGMTTMAEGTQIAAGALAAGVEEGAELEHYIGMVGDAAMGANRPVSEMAMIFNRVQGQGRLMTQELNMIEEGMPGFSQAMADHMGVSMDKFREMVTAGEVSSDDFMTVMDDFAGGMADEYAKSWEGMLANTKAYIGILGENLLGGVFEQSKLAIADFIELLKSPAAQEWAQNAGIALGNAFTKVVESIKGAVQWFARQDSWVQKLIGGFAAFAVALGPILTVFGGLVVAIGKVVSVFGGLFTALSGVFGFFGKVHGGLLMITKEGAKFATVFPRAGAVVKGLGAAFSVLTGPIGITIGILASLGAIFTTLMIKSEMFRSTIGNAFSLVIETFQELLSFLPNIGGGFSNLWNTIGTFFDGIKSIFQGDELGGEALLMAIGMDGSTIDTISGAVSGIRTSITGVFSTINQFIERMRNWKDALFAIFRGDDDEGDGILMAMGMGPGTIDKVHGFVQGVQNAFSTLRSIVSTIFSAVGQVITSAITGIIFLWQSHGPTLITVVSNVFNKAWEIIKVVFTNVVDIVRMVISRIVAFWQSDGQQIVAAVGNVFNIIKGIIQGVMAVVLPIVTTALMAIHSAFNFVFPAVKFIVQMVFENIKGVISGALNIIMGLVQVFSGLFTGDFSKMWEGVKNIFTGAIEFVWNAFQLMFWGRLIKGITSLVKGGLALFRNFGGGIGNIFTSIWNTAIRIFNGLRTSAMNIWNSIRNGITSVMNGFSNILRNIFTGIWNFTRNIFNNTRNFMTNVWNAIRNTVVNLARNLWTRVSNAWTSLWNATSNIFSTVRNFLSNTWNGIRNTVVNAAQNLWNRVRNVWNSFRNSTTSIFSGLRNWLMNTWNNIRMRIVLHANRLWARVRAIWNLFRSVTRTIFNSIRSALSNIWNNIRNRVTNTVSNLWNRVRNTWNAFSRTTNNIFSSLRNFLSNTWNNIRNRVTNTVSNLWNRVRNIWNSFSNTTNNIFSRLSNWLRNTWSNVRNRVVNTVSNLWSRVRNTWNNFRSTTSNIFGRIRDTITNIWNGIRDSMVNVASNLWNRVRRTFNNMKNGLKSIIDTIKDHIGGMVGAVKSGLNKLIDGVNWVADKIGMEKLPTFDLSTGTQTVNRKVQTTYDGALKNDTIATVGDKGPGNGPGGFRNEMIQYPNGRTVMTPNRDTTTFLPSGSRVINGQDTYDHINRPRLSLGTTGQGGIGSWISGIPEATGNALKSGAEWIGDTASNVWDKATDVIGDVWDFATNPGKLVDKVIDHFGFNFDFLEGSLIKDVMGGAYDKLKEGVKNLFTGWLDDSGGGDGSSFTKYGVTAGYSPNSPLAGYPTRFNNGHHYGIDYGTPSGTTIEATNSGTVDTMNDRGGGLIARLLTGQFTQFFMHLSDVLKTGGVSQGDDFAKTGNSGAWTTGAHLHYQVEKGESDYVTNENTIDPEKYLSGNASENDSGSAKRFRPQVMQALKANGLPTTKPYIDAWLNQIQSESSGNPSAEQQIIDINSGGNEARGLVQVIPPTFNAFKHPGHGDILDPLDNLLAGINYAKSRYGSTGMLSRIGKGIGYKKGGILQKEGFFYGAEGDKEEMVIPLTDPSNAMKLIAMAAEKVQGKGTQSTKMPNVPSSNGNNEQIEQLKEIVANQQEQIKQTSQMIKTLMGIEEKEFNLDGQKITDSVNEKNSVRSALQYF